jgi:hypothetical protein
VAAARRGTLQARATAKALLTPPPRPEALDYLLDWADQLAQQRRVGVNGLERLTYQDIEAWARLTGNSPSPLEVEALCVIDAAMLYPGKPEDEPR